MKFFFLVLSIFSLLFGVIPVHALTVAPARVTIVLNPGETRVVTIRIHNDTLNHTTIQGEVDAFTIDVRGLAVFGANDIARSWVRTSSVLVDLASGEEKELSFIVEVPQDAEPGVHYLGLFAREVSETVDGVNIGLRGGALFFLNVGGLISERLVPKVFVPTRRLYFHKPMELILELQNLGTVQTVPQGIIQIQPLFSRVSRSLPLNPDKKKVYSQSIWKERYIISGLSWRDIGPIRFHAITTLDDGTEESRVTTSVWYIPWQLLVGFGAVVTGIFLIKIMKR